MNDHRDGVRVVAMSAAHADGVLAVYQAGLDTGNASFETAAPSWSQWEADHLSHLVSGPVGRFSR